MEIVVIGGGTGALGRAVVTELEGGPWHLVVVARDVEEVDTRPGVSAITADLADAGAVTRLADEVRAMGTWYGLVNASGGFAPGRADRVRDEVIDAQLDLNLRGPWRLARAAAAAMREQGRGSIVNVVSATAIHPAGKVAPYAVSKAAMLRVTEEMALDLAGTGVRVNAVMPGTMDTPANRESMTGADRSAWVPLGDVARTIAWLLSASSVSGAAIPMARAE